ncbi:hypothetical protein EV13_1619 [Prochlorococcus sp. MIT 0702]|nr:hypothetical protein EV13_1619 [Prochlorococcus sp. MIT 0702]KGG28683.1 hypothetical protein EV12_0578 [Prochlorococcus sp. MIT 0701]KGG36327.1 hypothetical protein EV14_0421 [Prochlorococcus sp. MIT 0703]
MWPHRTAEQQRTSKGSWQQGEHFMAAPEGSQDIPCSTYLKAKKAESTKSNSFLERRL